MRIKWVKFILSAIFIFLLASNGKSQFNTWQTKYLNLIYYSKGHEYVVPYIARCFENAYSFHRNIFQYEPKERITVFLEDFGDFASGSAGTLPHNLINLGISPFSYVYETMTANERFNLIMNHELTHIITMDKAAGSDNFFRSLFFGKVTPHPEHPISMFYFYLTSPRWTSPRWYGEGIAVFMETWMGGGVGRGLGAYDEMVFRTKVLENGYFYDVVGLESEATKTDFQVGATSYIYGTRFMSYVANQYGPEKVVQWVNRNKESNAYFARQFKNSMGQSLDQVWSNWTKWERKWQQANLDSIRQNPVTPFRRISKEALGSVSRTYYNSKQQKLYAAVRYPGQVAHLAEIDIRDGKLRKIRNIKGPALFYVTSLAYDSDSQILFYTTDNNGWRDLNSINLKTGHSRLLLKDGRVGDLTFCKADQSIWGVRHFNGISTLVRIPYPYNEWNQIYSFPYGQDIFDIDISPDGKMITSALTEIDGKQKLIKMEVEKLMSGDKKYNIIFDFDVSTPANFSFSPDGKYLIGSSYYSGVSNIFRYDIAKKDMSILTNCETGFFRPVYVSEDSLAVLRFTEKGFVPVMIANQTIDNVNAINYLGSEIADNHEIVRSWTLKPPSTINIDSVTTFKGKYNNFRSINLSSIYPIIQGYKESAAYGIRFDFASELGISGFDLTTSYSPGNDIPNNEKFHIGFNFHHWQWKISATYNVADFYDLFGPTKNSRKGYSASLEYKKNLVFDEPKALDFSTKLAGYGGLEILPEFQNAKTAHKEAVSFSASLNYKFLRKSLGAVEDELGVRWKINSFNNYVNSELFSRVSAELDYGILLPINHSSIWLRSSGGYSFGDRDEPFANFFLGGFGNNWIDHLGKNRYRNVNSFPGISLEDTDVTFPSGITFGKITGEWTLPPIRFRRFGVSSLYFRWMRLSLFGSGLITDFDSSQHTKKYMSLGAQLNFQIILFAHLNSTFSLGYAKAAKENRRPSDEFMISLKIL